MEHSNIKSSELREVIIGILGGMGPEATVEIFRRIIDITPSKKDQDHLHIIIDNNPKIPDRTAAILGKGESPLPLLTSTAKNLEKAGASFIIIPCNTAHHYIDLLRREVSIPIVDMLEETVNEIYKELPNSNIGLLASTGTIKAKIYQKAANKKNLKIIIQKRIL